MGQFTSTLCNLAAELAALVPWFTWENIKSFLNSGFTTALAGAFAGAWAAQRIAERGKLREELEREIHNTNAGITLAFSVANTMLALKKQHVRELKDSYDRDCQRFKETSAAIAAGKLTPDTHFSLAADLRNIPVLSPPATTLQEVVCSRVSVVGRPLSLAVEITESAQNLNAAIVGRGNLIEAFKAGNLPEGATVEKMYLGIPYRVGHVNQEYGDLVRAIALYTDDTIFFSSLLCQDLRAHGLRTAEKYRTRLKKEPPRVSETSFKEAKESGLMPADDEYVSWLKGFQAAQEDEPSWVRRLWASLKGRMGNWATDAEA